MTTLAVKHCSKCGLDKPVTHFNARLASRDGLMPACRQCCCERDRRRRAKALPIAPIESGTKRCTRCGAEKPVNEFYPDKSKRLGRTEACRECFKRRQRNLDKGYYARKTDAQKAKRRAQARDRYSKKDKGAERQRRAAWERRKRQTDPVGFRQRCLEKTRRRQLNLKGVTVEKVD